MEGDESMVVANEKSKSHSEQDKMVESGIPVNTKTFFNFSKGERDRYENKEGVKYSVLGMVSHEMQHQYDYDQGNMKDATRAIPRADRPQEKRAVQNENRARKLEGLPMRTTYGGVKIKFNNK